MLIIESCGNHGIFQQPLFSQHPHHMSGRNDIIRRQAELAARLFEPGRSEVLGMERSRSERDAEARGHAAHGAAAKGKKRALNSESEYESEPRPRPQKVARAGGSHGAAGSYEESEEPCSR